MLHLHPRIRAIPALGPIERGGPASLAPALPIRTGHPDRSKERATGLDSDSDADIKGRIVRVLIGMVEIWMDPSYDLW